MEKEDMFVSDLNSRRKAILQSIVELYIETALPVSSQAVTQRIRVRISAATIRNAMAELAQLGLIWQPHTSAGRVPTDQGYRYYIDSLLDWASLPDQEMESIQSDYSFQSAAFEETLSKALSILSKSCQYTALAFSYVDKDKFYFQGVSCILEQPEFQDARKLQALLRTFEHPQPLLSIMKQDLRTEGVQVHIGKENPYADIQECSLVVSNLKVRDRNLGALGVIGPRRMSYAKTISAVNYMAELLSKSVDDSVF